MQLAALPTAVEAASTLAIIASSHEPLLFMTANLTLISASTSFCKAFEIDPASISGRRLAELGEGEWNLPRLTSLLRATASGSAQIDAYEIELKRKGRAPQTLLLHAHKLDDGGAFGVRLIVAITDITLVRAESRKKDDLIREKAILLQEVQHIDCKQAACSYCAKDLGGRRPMVNHCESVGPDAEANPKPPGTRMAGRHGIDGVAWAYRFSKAGVAELIEGPAVLEALERQEVWIWVNFDLADERASAAIAALPHLPAGALAMLCADDERQQIDGFGQAMGGVVADYEARDPFDENLVVRRNFVIAPYAILSAGRHPSYALDRLRVDLQSGRRLSDVVALFHALTYEMATATSLVLGELGSRLNEMEERALDQKEIGLDVLGQSRRRLVRLRRQALPLRGLLIRMLSERPYWFDGDSVIGCQRIIARMEALIDDLDAYQERAHTLQDELKGREAEKTNKRLAVLAIVSALLLPPTFFTGVFGMNMTGMPFQQNAYGFWIACALMVASVVGMLVMLRRIRLI